MCAYVCTSNEYIINLITVPTAPHNFNSYIPTTNTGVTLSVTLTWSRPDPPNGLITQYNVSNITNSYCLRLSSLPQVSYSVIDFQSETVHNYNILQLDNSCSCSICSIESSYTWNNLIQGEYQFRVVAFTSKGSGETANLILSTIPNNCGKLAI